jgi:cation-transporting P-type ATPase E
VVGRKGRLRSCAPRTLSYPLGGGAALTTRSDGCLSTTAAALPDSGSPGGLTANEVADRVANGLTNDAAEPTSRPLSHIIRANVMTPFNALLGALAAAVAATGAWGDALFALVVVLNSSVGVIQELRAKRTLDELAVLAAPRARVVRDGDVAEIAVEHVVQDDLLILRAGDQIVADGVVRTTRGLEIDESLLTGEADPVSAQDGDAVLSGSVVVAGSGTVQVTAVGASSFASRLTAEARRFTVTSSELVRGINRILRYVTVAIIVTAPFLFLSQLRATSDWRVAVRGAVAGLVGMVPEGLVLLTSLAFMAAAVTLGRRRILVRELPAVEGLARVDVMCVDKTGTLTDGHLVFTGLERLDRGVTAVEEALGALAAEDGANATALELRAHFPTPAGWTATATVPFSSSRKWSAASFDGRGSWVLGAPEMMLPGIASAADVAARADAMAAGGSRTLLVAHSPEPLNGPHLPPGLHAAAIITFEERVRRDAATTLRYFADQGVGVRVISGDNPRTVGVIARRVGLPGALEPVDVRAMPADNAELVNLMEDRTVFGRVTPAQKQAMVAALQAAGHVVAMTGDGVNDVLALKVADIGVAMGSGAPATRAVAQLVLLDNEFSVMPGVVAEGRRVIANIERVANLFLTKNVLSLVLSITVAIVRWPYPFLPRHLTLVSGLAIGIPGFCLALGPSQERFRSGFVGRVLRFAVPAGVIAAAAVMSAYGLARAERVAPVEARTATTLVFMIVSLWVLVIQARPLQPWKVGLVAAMAGLFLLVLALPDGRRLYDLRLPATEIVIEAVALAGLASFAIEVSWRLLRYR